jgi:hypothetical protein
VEVALGLSDKIIVLALVVMVELVVLQTLQDHQYFVREAVVAVAIVPLVVVVAQAVAVQRLVLEVLVIMELLILAVVVVGLQVQLREAPLLAVMAVRGL